MPHQHSVLYRVLKLLPWDALDASVARHGAAELVRDFSCRSQLVAMLYAQLSGSTSLRHIEAGLASHADRLYHLGAVPASRSTLADANRRRPATIFTDLLGTMLGHAQRRMRQSMGSVVRLIDSTSLPLKTRSADWARFSDQACGAKLHVVYDPDADRPVYVAVSTAKVNDITAAKAMPIPRGADVVFDLGFYDFGWWAELDAADCRIVTRLKRNTPLTVQETRPVQGDRILGDRIGRLPARQASRRRNPFDKPIRELRVRIDTGKIIRIATNDLDAPAAQIADLYKRRWAIELFFRWIKQTLQITRFVGTSENAVRTQVAAALIAFLLLRLAQATQRAVGNPLQFARLIRANLMHRRPLDHLRRPPPRPTRWAQRAPPGQASLFAA